MTERCPDCGCGPRAPHHIEHCLGGVDPTDPATYGLAGDQDPALISGA